MDDGEVLQLVDGLCCCVVTAAACLCDNLKDVSDRSVEFGVKRHKLIVCASQPKITLKR